MLAIRIVKIALVAAVAFFATLVAFGNVTDYWTIFAFVQHVLSMGTIFPHSTITYRAITSPLLHHLAYCIIIATETLIAVLCWTGAVVLLRRLSANAAAFNAGKPIAVLGLALAFLLWQVGFMSIGGEWFGMWQSKDWNGVESAFRFVAIAGVVLLLVVMPDGELARPRRR